jgi:hypothetical protein
MIDGKPYFFEVIAKTRDTNIRNRKEILWPNREITEKTEWWKAQSLTITKKYKYWNKKQKK